MRGVQSRRVRGEQAQLFGTRSQMVMHGFWSILPVFFAPDFRSHQFLTHTTSSAIDIFSKPYIDSFFWPIRRYLFFKFQSFNFISLSITISFFFRLNPIFFKALDIVLALISPDHSDAISTWVLSPLTSTNSFNFSQLVILWPFPGGLFGNAWKSPVSRSRFSHSLIVSRLILNIWLASLIFSPSSLMA